MLVSREFPFGSQAFQRMGLQTALISLQIIENSRFKDHEAAIYPTLSYLRFLSEVHDHIVAIENQAAESCRGPDRRDRSDATMGLVKSKQVLQVYVSHAVAISDHECSIVQQCLQALQAAAGIRLLT